MSNRRKLIETGPRIDASLAAEIRTGETWQIRLMSVKPHVIEDHAEMAGLRAILERGRILMERMSYMVNGPNREVMWSLDRWVPDLHEWHSQKQGTYTMKKGQKPR